MKIVQIVLSGIAGGFAWFLGLNFLFGSAQGILSNPEFQSSKVLAVFYEIEPFPKTSESIWFLILGLLLIGLFHSAVFSFLESRLHDKYFFKGIQFGLISWALMTPWFEFYLLWNVLHEPILLVLLEAFLWLLLLQLVGFFITFSNKFLKKSL